MTIELQKQKAEFFARVFGIDMGGGQPELAEVTRVPASRIEKGRPWAWLPGLETAKTAAVVAPPAPAVAPTPVKSAPAVSSKPTVAEIQAEADKLSDFDAFAAAKQLVEESKTRKLNEEEAAGLAALNARADRQMTARQRVSVASIQGLLRRGDRDALKGLQAIRIEALAPRRKEPAEGELHGKARMATAFGKLETATAKQPQVATFIAQHEAHRQRMEAAQAGGELHGKARMAAAINRDIEAKGVAS